MTPLYRKRERILRIVIELYGIQRGDIFILTIREAALHINESGWAKDFVNESRYTSSSDIIFKVYCFLLKDLHPAIRRTAKQSRLIDIYTNNNGHTESLIIKQDAT